MRADEPALRPARPQRAVEQLAAAAGAYAKELSALSAVAVGDDMKRNLNVAQCDSLTEALDSESLST